MISVLVPVLIREPEHLNMTIRCIETARKNTDIDFELVCIETSTVFLADYCDVYIHEKNKTNATKSINRGLRACSGEYVVLLTNDVFVKERWLECLLECFEIDDCGLSTLATTQHNHKKENKIKEGIWFSLAMMRRKDNYFDESFINSWDDTDLIMRTYIDGKKMYRNYGCVVDHLIGATQYGDPKHEDNFLRNKKLFMDKYKNYSDNKIYHILTSGTII